MHHDDLKGQHGVTTDTALSLSRYFELRVREIESGKDIADRVHPREPAQVDGPDKPLAARG